MNNKTTILNLFSAFSIALLLASCAAAYTGGNFNTAPLPEGDYYVMTKDGVKHPYTGIYGEDLIKKWKFYLSATEIYPSEDVIAYKLIHRQYGRAKNVVKEYKRIDGVFSERWVKGFINVYNRHNADVPSKFYVQKGEDGPFVELIPQNGKKALYEMMKDYAPSKAIIDEYINRGIAISFEKIVQAINTYNNR